MTGLPYICTEDGTVIVRDPRTGLVVSGCNVVDAMAELRRLLTHPRACAQPTREGVAA